MRPTEEHCISGQDFGIQLGSTLILCMHVFSIFFLNEVVDNLLLGCRAGEQNPSNWPSLLPLVSRLGSFQYVVRSSLVYAFHWPPLSYHAISMTHLFSKRKPPFLLWHTYKYDID